MEGILYIHIDDIKTIEIKGVKFYLSKLKGETALSGNKEKPYIYYPSPDDIYTIQYSELKKLVN